MKKALFAAFVCLLLSVIPLQVKDGTLNVFYGLIVLIFIVGITLIASFKGRVILNKEFKEELRCKVHDARNKYLLIFLLCSAMYVVYLLLPNSWQLLKWEPIENVSIHFTWSLSVLLYHIYSMIALVSNYLEIQRLYEDIVDRIANELLHKKDNKCDYESR